MAKIFLGSNEIFTVGANSTADVYGLTGGTEKIIATAGAVVNADQNVERVELSGASSSYTYAVSGNVIKVLSGTTTVATIGAGANAQTIAFSDGSAALALTGLNTATLGGQAISATATGAALSNITLNAADKSASAVSGGTSGGTNIPGAGFTLTSNADLVTGTDANDTINGLVVTLAATGALVDSAQNVDIIDGGAGTDTLNLQTSSGGTLGFKLTNVETVNYTVFADQTFNMSNATGVTALNNLNSIANLTVNSVPKILDLGLKSTATTTTNLNYVAAAVTGSNDTQKITLNGATDNAVIDFDNAIGGIENFAITTTGAASKVKIDDAGAVANITIAGDQALTLAFNLTNVGATALKTVDGSAATGKLTLDLATNVAASDITVKTNTGDDSVTVDNFNKDDSINLGAGTDKLTIKVADATTVAAVNALGVEVLNFKLNTDGDNADEAYTYNLSLATDITTVGVGKSVAATLGNQATLTLASLPAGATTLNLNGDGAAADEDVESVVFGLATTTGTQSLNINVTNTDASGNLINTTKGVQLASVVTANGIETINLTTTQLHADTNATTQDGGLAMSLTTDYASVIKVVSPTLVDLTGVVLDDSINTVDASAANGGFKVDVGAAADAENTVAGNKVVNITTGAGQDTVQNILGSVATTVKTGAGDDTISIVAATDILVKLTIDAGDGNDLVDISGDTSAIAKAITLGAGSDRLTIATTAAGLQTAITLKDFAPGVGGDVLDLTNAAADIVVGGTQTETKYVEAAVFADQHAFGGMNVFTVAIATLDDVGVKAGLLAANGAVAVTVTDNDIFFLIASNGVDAGLFRVADGAGAANIGASTITLVGTFSGVSDASTFAVQNFSDFLA